MKFCRVSPAPELAAAPYRTAKMMNVELREEIQNAQSASVSAGRFKNQGGSNCKIHCGTALGVNGAKPPQARFRALAK